MSLSTIGEKKCTLLHPQLSQEDERYRLHKLSKTMTKTMNPVLDL